MRQFATIVRVFVLALACGAPPVHLVADSALGACGVCPPAWSSLSQEVHPAALVGELRSPQSVARLRQPAGSSFRGCQSTVAQATCSLAQAHSAGRTAELGAGQFRSYQVPAFTVRGPPSCVLARS
jgi:hypothetical protein